MSTIDGPWGDTAQRETAIAYLREGWRTTAGALEEVDAADQRLRACSGIVWSGVAASAWREGLEVRVREVSVARAALVELHERIAWALRSLES